MNDPLFLFKNMSGTLKAPTVLTTYYYCFKMFFGPWQSAPDIDQVRLLEAVIQPRARVLRAVLGTIGDPDEGHHVAEYDGKHPGPVETFGLQQHVEQVVDVPLPMIQEEFVRVPKVVPILMFQVLR